MSERGGGAEDERGAETPPAVTSLDDYRRRRSERAERGGRIAEALIRMAERSGLSVLDLLEGAERAARAGLTAAELSELAAVSEAEPAAGPAREPDPKK